MTTKEQVDSIQKAIDIILDMEVRVRFLGQVNEALNLLVKVGKDLASKEVEKNENL